MSVNSGLFKLAALLLGFFFWWSGGSIGLLIMGLSILLIMLSPDPVRFMLGIISFLFSWAFIHIENEGVSYFRFYGGGLGPFHEVEIVFYIFILLAIPVKLKVCGSIYFPPISQDFSRLSIVFLVIALGISSYVIANEKPLFNNAYDLEGIGRNPLYEYSALFLLMAYYFCGGRLGLKKIILLVSLVSATIMLVYSYRLAGISCFLVFAYGVMEGKGLKKSFLLLGAVFLFMLLSYINYARHGDFSVDIPMLLGYQNGLLDNNFTGSIETGLIFIEELSGLNSYSVARFTFGFFYPLPKSFMPESFDFAAYLYSKRLMPGGGVISGYIAFSGLFLFLPLVLFYRAIGSVSRSQAGVKASYLVIFIVLPRFMIYSPAIFFKYYFMFFIVYIFAAALGMRAKRSNISV